MKLFSLLGSGVFLIDAIKTPFGKFFVMLLLVHHLSFNP